MNSTSSYTGSPSGSTGSVLAYVLPSLDDARRVDDLRRLSEHRADAAIARARQLQRAIYCRLLDTMPREGVLDRNLHEYLRMRLGAHAARAHGIASHLLPLLFENGDDVHADAAEQGHQRQLHRAESSVLPAIRLAHVNGQRVA